MTQDGGKVSQACRGLPPNPNNTAGVMDMPLYLDVHRSVPGANAKDVAEAHMKDVQVQGKYGVRYLRYWVDENEGRIWCLLEAPDKETAARVHREAHGLVADEIHEVAEGS